MNHKKNIAIDVIGWYGVLALLASYALASFGVIVAHSVTYQALNVTGALGIVIEALSKKDYEPAFLNIVWAVIGIVALVGIIRALS